jgi:hypothetical protein
LATWQLIQHASETLQRILQDRVDAEPSTPGVTVQIATTTTFNDLKTTLKPYITIFLYRVVENAELRNSPQRRLPDGSLQRQPMVVDLCYLITPWGARPDTSPPTDEKACEEEHQLLGLILQTFYEHAEIGRSDLYEDPDPSKPRVWGATDSIQLIMESLPVEDLYRIWDPGELPYRLSAAYRARVLGIEPTSVRKGSPVVDAAFRVGRAE